MSLALKPCPFCGSAGAVHVHPEIPSMHIVGCSDEDCIAWMAAYDFVSQETAIAAWNRRATAAAEVSAEQIKHMVGRFLAWRLPDNFNPDGGISFAREFNQHTAHPMKHEPMGTNLFDANQAKEMIQYVVAGLPATGQEGSAEDDGAAMRHTLSAQETDKSDRAEGVAALQQAGDQFRCAAEMITPEMVNAAWNAGKDRRMTGLPTDFRAVLEAALGADRMIVQKSQFPTDGGAPHDQK